MKRVRAKTVLLVEAAHASPLVVAAVVAAAIVVATRSAINPPF